MLHWCRYYEDLKEENKRYPGQAPFPWLEAQFKQLGLDVYREVLLIPTQFNSNLAFFCSVAEYILQIGHFSDK